MSRRPSAPNYLGGLLSSDARVAIHFVHRVGAVAVLLVAGFLALRLGNRPAAWVLTGVLTLQLALGVANVVFVLPLAVAVLHNAGAAALLLVVVAIRLAARPAGRGCRAGYRARCRYSAPMKWVLTAVFAVGLVGGGLAFAFLAPEPGLSDEELTAFGFTAFPEPRTIEAFSPGGCGRRALRPEPLSVAMVVCLFRLRQLSGHLPDDDGDARRCRVAAACRRRAGPSRGSSSASIPTGDTPDLLAAYVASFSENFVGVTGSAAAIALFGKSLHAAFLKAPVEDSALDYLMDHSNHIAVVDPLGRHYGFIRPPHDVQQLTTLTRALTQRWNTGRG